MELRQIRYFLEIVKQKGFNRASKSLSIAQPALSISVRKLEDELGVKLLNRRERGGALTEEGRVFVKAAQKIDSLALNIKQQMAEYSCSERGAIRVGIPGMLAVHCFSDMFSRFRQCYPNMRITVHSDGAQRLQELTRAGELDAAIIARQNLSDDLSWQPLLQVDMVACVAPGHHLAERDSITLEEMSCESLFLFSEGHYQRKLINDGMAELGLKPRVVFESNLPQVLATLTAKGGGVTTLLREAVPEWLVPISFDPPLIIESVVAWNGDSSRSSLIKTYVDFIVKENCSCSTDLL
jgi:DNA-binding transcriptional LysR family regulator